MTSFVEIPDDYEQGGKTNKKTSSSSKEPQGEAFVHFFYSPYKEE